MKTCPHCAESIQDAAKICPHCRRRQPLTAAEAATSRRRWWIGTALVVALAIATVLVAANDRNASNREACNGAMRRGSGLTIDECMDLIRKNGRDATLGIMDPSRR